MCEKAVDTYPSTTKFFPQCLDSKNKCCVKVVNRRFLVFDSIPYRYKTQKMCGKAVDSLETLKLTPDWFVTSKMIKKLFTVLCADENMLYFNKDSVDVVSNCNEMGIPNIDLNNINLDNNFDKEDPDTITLVSLLAWHIRFEKHKAFKNN